MTHPFGLLAPGTLASLFGVLTVVAFALGLVQAVLNAPLRNPAAPRGIVSFELAGSEAVTGSILDSWDVATRARARLGLWFDLPFIAAYSLALSAGCVWAAPGLAAKGVGTAAWGAAVAWLAGLAGALDLVEDVALLRQLRDGASGAWAAVARGAAIGKFALAGLAVAYVGAGLAAWVSGDWSQRTQSAVAILVAAGIAWAYRGSLAGLLRFTAGHAVLALAVALLLGLVYGQIGADYGVPSLFWNDRVLPRIGAALGATLVLAEFGVIAYFASPDLIDALLGPPAWAGHAATVGQHYGRLSRFLGRGGLPFALLLLLPALTPAAFPAVPQALPVTAGDVDLNRSLGATNLINRDPIAWGLNLAAWGSGVALGVAIVAGLLAASPLLHRLFATLGTSRRFHVRTSLLTFYASFALAYALMSTLLYRFVSPAFAICALIGVVVMGYSLSAYFGDGLFPWLKGWPLPPRFVVPAALALWFAWVNSDPFKLRFPEMTAYYPAEAGATAPNLGPIDLRTQVRELYLGPEPPPPRGRARLVDDRAALNAWVARTRRATADAGAKPKLAVVCVSGGASRSAYWTAVALDRLSDQIPGFGRHVRVVTGASGGMVGAAYFLKQRWDLAGGRQAVVRPLTREIPADSLTPVARQIALRDPWQAFLPRISPADRGTILEAAWPGTGFALQDLAPLEAAGEVPSIILSPMMVEDGRRLLVSNLDLWPITGAVGSEVVYSDPGTTAHPYSLSAVEFFRLFPDADRFALATGVRMSASFPFVSPAVNLPTNPTRRVVDAGYYDNYGVQTATAWIRQNFEALLWETSGVVLVQIRDAVSEVDRLDVADAPTGAWAAVARGFQFFTSPVEGALAARSSVNSFQNDQSVQDLGDLFTDAVRKALKAQGSAETDDLDARSRAFFTTVLFENSAEVSFAPPKPGSWPGDDDQPTGTSGGVGLDWYLSRAERDGLTGAIPTVPAGSRWEDPAARRARIDWLSQQVEAASGAERDRRLIQLEQARNYERLVQLTVWWTAPGPLP